MKQLAKDLYRFLRALVLYVVALATCACFSVPAGLDDQLESLVVSHEVFFVSCVPAALELAIGQTGQCEALNADSTRIDFEGFAPVTWDSSFPSAATVSTDGSMRAETAVSNNVVVTAHGTNGTSAFAIVTTF